VAGTRDAISARTFLRFGCVRMIVDDRFHLAVSF